MIQSRQGPYNSKDDNNKSNGLFKVLVNGSETGDDAKVSFQAQINALKHVVENSEIIRNEILRELIIAGPDMKNVYGEYLPDLSDVENLKDFMGLSTIHIMASHKDESAYVGFEFGCIWDEEHGLGVMTHKNNVITIGHADKAFDPWPTYADNGTKAQMTEKWENDNKKVKRLWWKFWS